MKQKTIITGDFLKFNEETIQAIEDAENNKDMTQYKTLEEFLKALDEDNDD